MKKTLFAMALAALPAPAATPMLEEVTLALPGSGLLAHGDYYGGSNTNVAAVFNHVKGYAADGAYAGNNGGLSSGCLFYEGKELFFVCTAAASAVD